MEDFSVRLSGMNQRIAEEESLIGQLKKLETEIESIKGRINFQVKGKAGIKGSLERIGAEIESHVSALGGMKNALENISNLYQATEKKNAGMDGIFSNIGAALGTAVIGGIGANISIGNGIGGGISIGGINASAFIGDGVGVSIHNSKDSVSGGIYGMGGVIDAFLDDKVQIKYKDKFEIYKDKQREIGTKGELEYKDEKWQVVKKEKYDTAKDSEKESKKEKEDDGKRKKKFLENITIASAKTGVSSALWEGKFENDHSSLKADAFKFEAKASAFLNAAGAGGEIGIGVSALHTEMEGQIGNDNFGAHMAGDITVGKLSAKAGGKIGFLDENGNAALNLGVNAAAEAIALQANASAGVDILGADVGVKAGVTVGVGAHANIGYYNGKVKFDVGAAMGLGVNVDLEIDLSKPIGYLNDIKDGISDAWDEGKKFVSNLFKW